MNRSQTIERVRMVADEIPGYDYGSPSTAKSPITLQEFEALKQSATFTKEDEHWLRVAGETLADQTKELVGKWRDIIAKHPHLARYSQRQDGQKDQHYSETSGLRFQQWVLDTCLRPYDQDWLDYQQEMALRHTSVKKNKTDDAQSVPTIHLSHHCVRCRNHRPEHTQTIACEKRSRHGGGGQNAPGMVEIHLAADGALDRAVHQSTTCAK